MTTANDSSIWSDLGLTNPFAADQASGWVVAVCFLLGAYYFLYPRNSSSSSGKQRPPLVPCSTYEVFSKFFSNDGPLFLLMLSRKVSKVFGLPLAPPGTSWYVVGDPAVARHVLEDHKALKWTTAYGFLDQVAGGSTFFAAEGPRYKHARKSTSAAFARPHLPRMTTIVQQTLDEWTQQTFQTNQPQQPDDDQSVVMDVSEEMQRLTIRVIARVAFDYDLTDQQVEASTLALQTAYREFALRTPQNPLRRLWWFFPKAREAHRAAGIVRNLCRDMLADFRKREETTNATITPNTVLYNMVHDLGYHNDEERLRDMVVYLAGGYDTTSYTISWTLLELARHRTTHQKRLRHELRRLSTSERPQCPFLKQVLRESMRLHAVAALGGIRILPRNVYLPTTTTNGSNTGGGLVMERNAIVQMPLCVVHRDGNVFEEPDQFWPERWENPTPAMSKAWMAFGVGRRNCPGQALANIELCTVLAQLCTDYEWTVEQPGHTEYYVTLKTVDTLLRATPTND